MPRTEMGLQPTRIIFIKETPDMPKLMNKRILVCTNKDIDLAYDHLPVLIRREPDRPRMGQFPPT